LRARARSILDARLILHLILFANQLLRQSIIFAGCRGGSRLLFRQNLRVTVSL
jgi:hypothetical protein